MLLEEAIVALMRMVPKGVKLPKKARTELARTILMLQKGMPTGFLRTVEKLDLPPQIPSFPWKEGYYEAVPFGKHRGMIGLFHHPQKHVVLMPTRARGFTRPLHQILAHEVGHAVHYSLAEELGSLLRYFERIPRIQRETIAEWLGKTQLHTADLPYPRRLCRNLAPDITKSPAFRVLWQRQGDPWQIVHDYIKRLGDDLAMKRPI